MEENNRLIADLAKRSHAYESAKRAAGELSKLAHNSQEDETVDNIKQKLSNLDGMWGTILKETEDRGRSLEDTYKISVKFWKELGDVTALIKEFEAVLHAQEPPAVEVNYIRKQQDALQVSTVVLLNLLAEFAFTFSSGRQINLLFASYRNVTLTLDEKIVATKSRASRLCGMPCTVVMPNSFGPTLFPVQTVFSGLVDVQGTSFYEECLCGLRFQ